ncbi:hypothetical protein Gpo141_00014149 [Globisporangium polare]
MPTANAQAWALVTECVDALSAARSHIHASLYLCDGATAEPNSEDLFTRKTWIHADVGNASSSRELRGQLRALIELVSQLSVNSCELAWRENYHSFWKSALVDSLMCSFCSYNISVKPDPTEFGDVEKLTKSDGPRFLLDFSKVQGKDGEELGLLRDLLFQKKRFQEHEGLLSKLTARSRRPPIELAVTLSRKKRMAMAQLRALADLLEANAELGQEQLSSGAGSIERVRYEMTTLLLLVSSSDEDEAMDLDVVADLLASKASTIRHLRISNTLKQVAEPANMQAFQRLLQTTVCSSLETSQLPKLQSLELENVPYTPTLLVSICSALRYKNSLRALDFNWVLNEPGAAALAGDRADVKTELMWAWLAFGVFHPDSDVQLDRLALSGLPLSAMDTRFVTTTLLSPHPCEQLWELEHGSLPSNIGARIKLPASQRAFVHATAKEVRELPRLEAPVVEPNRGQLEREYELAMEFTGWVCVVVPGCGFGWTPSTAITSRRVVPSKCLEVGPAGFWQLEGKPEPIAAANVKTFSRYALARMYQAEDWQEDEHDDIEVVKRLLRMIGHGLVGLDYASHGIPITDEDLREILDACPNLTRLNLKGNQLEGVTSLAARYAAQQCRITSLNVDTEYKQDQVLSQVAELLETSTPLRFIGVSGKVSTAEPLERFGRAIQASQTLHTVMVNEVRNENDALVAQMQTAFQSSPMRVRMSLEAKLAFVSVIYAYARQGRGFTEKANERKSRSALGTLDSSLLSEIFAFAAFRTGRSLHSLYWT